MRLSAGDRIKLTKSLILGPAYHANSYVVLPEDLELEIIEFNTYTDYHNPLINYIKRSWFIICKLGDGVTIRLDKRELADNFKKIPPLQQLADCS